MSWDPNSIRDDFPILARTVHRERPLVFLDNAASTQHPVAVLDAMDACYRKYYANVHRGVHRLSQEASDAYDAARARVASFVGAERAEEIVFVAGTTMGINLVARSLGESGIGPEDEILLTEMEHHSNIVPWQQLAARCGARVRFLPIRDDGMLALERLDEYLSPRTRIVAFTAVSNVVGTINPVAELVARAKRVGAMVLVDAAQHVPHDRTDVRAWGADFVVFSGHKMLGPTGIGVLWGRYDRLESLPPFLGGGSMITEVTTTGFVPNLPPAKFEAGTPPIVEAVGLHAAIDYLESIGLDRIARHEAVLASHAIDAMSAIDGVRILGPGADQRAGIVSFVVDGVSSQDLCVFLDLKGFALRNGHHCAMPLHERLGVSSSCRASFYLYNTAAEIDRFATTLRSEIDRLR